MFLTGLSARGVLRVLSVEISCLAIGYIALLGLGRDPTGSAFCLDARSYTYGTAQTMIGEVVTLVDDSGSAGATDSTEHHYGSRISRRGLAQGLTPLRPLLAA